MSGGYSFRARRFLMIACTAWWLCGQGVAQGLEAGGDVTMASGYIWQGIDYSNDGAVLQPQLWLSEGGISATVWFNYDLDTDKIDESDIFLQYDWAVDQWSLAAGVAYFHYPQNPPHRDAWPDSQEVYVSASHAGPLNPSIAINHDFDAGAGSYLTLGMSHTLPMAVHPLTLDTRLYYQDGYYGVTGFPALEVGAAMEAVAGSYTLTPKLAYFYAWDNGDFKGAGDLPNQWYLALTVSRSF